MQGINLFYRFLASLYSLLDTVAVKESQYFYPFA